MKEIDMKERSIQDGVLGVLICGVITSAVIFCASSVHARVNTIKGGASWGTEYLDKNGEQRVDDDSYTRMRFTPTFDFSTVSERNELNFIFSPSIRYDFDSYDTNVDFTAGIDGNNMFNENWTAGFADNFVLGDTSEYDPNAEPTFLDPVSSDGGRRKYWTNDFELYSEYIYAKESTSRLTYVYTKLENDSSDAISSNYENYDKHQFRLNVNHTFNPFWSLDFSSAYIKGLYDSPTGNTVATDSDVDEYRFTTGVTSRVIEHHAITLNYTYTGSEYADAGRKNSDLHSPALLWQWEYSPEIVFDASSGATYRKTDGYDGSWGWNGGAGVAYTLERSSVRFSVDQRYDAENFTGSTNENGVKRIQEATLNWHYNILENTNLGAFVTYREDRQYEQTLTGEGLDTEKWITGANVSQKFWQYYAANLAYSYADQTSDRIGDTYNEHRLNLTFSYENEFFKW